jgi:hypothetical protein
MYERLALPFRLLCGHTKETISRQNSKHLTQATSRCSIPGMPEEMHIAAVGMGGIPVRALRLLARLDFKGQLLP